MLQATPQSRLTSTCAPLEVIAMVNRHMTSIRWQRSDPTNGEAEPHGQRLRSLVRRPFFGSGCSTAREAGTLLKPRTYAGSSGLQRTTSLRQGLTTARGTVAYICGECSTGTGTSVPAPTGSLM